MVNFNDPARVAQDFLTMVKLWHTVNGLFIWEFITTLDYKWSVIQGRRPYRWTIWIYSLTRVATLLALIMNMISFDTASPIHCQAWVAIEMTFVYTAAVTGLMLLVLRTIAIWSRDKIVSTIAICMWLANISFLIYSFVQLRSSWDPVLSTCTISMHNPDTSKYNMGLSFSTNVILFSMMLVGLFRLRLGAGTLGLGRLLWTQGVTWYLLSIMVELPTAVFILLNLSPPWNLMFQNPALISMTIAATRMYRALTDFSSPDISLDVPKTLVVASPQRVPPVTIPLPVNQVEKDKHMEPGQYLESGANHHGLYTSTNTNVWVEIAQA